MSMHVALKNKRQEAEIVAGEKTMATEEKRKTDDESRNTVAG